MRGHGEVSCWQRVRTTYKQCLLSPLFLSVLLLAFLPSSQLLPILPCPFSLLPLPPFLSLLFLLSSQVA
jgi:hypothetical protein